MPYWQTNRCTAMTERSQLTSLETALRWTARALGGQIVAFSLWMIVGHLTGDAVGRRERSSQEIMSAWPCWAWRWPGW